MLLNPQKGNGTDKGLLRRGVHFLGWDKLVETHIDTERGSELVSGTFGYFSHFHRLTKLTE
jgi:hypothetical protein